MLINSLILSPIISLLAIIFLYPLKNHYQSHATSRAFALIILFPAFISTFYLFCTASNKGIITSKTTHLINTPILLSTIVSPETTIYLLFIISSMFLSIILYPTQKYTENISTTALSLLVISIVLLTSDLLLKITFLSIGTLAVSMLEIQESSTSADEYIIWDFIIHRISDFLCISVILIIFASNNFSTNNPFFILNHFSDYLATVFYLALTLRLSSFIIFNLSINAKKSSFKPILVSRKIIIGSGTMILIQSLQLSTYLGDRFWLIFKIAAMLMIIIMIFLVFFRLWALTFIDNLTTIIIFVTLFLYTANINTASTVANGFIILLSPMLLTNSFRWPIYTQQENSKTTETRNFSLALTQAKKSVNFSVQVLNSAYSSIFFYFTPQLFTFFLQSILRIFHTGNIQRSLIFVAFICLAYVYWWGII